MAGLLSLVMGGNITANPTVRNLLFAALFPVNLPLAQNTGWLQIVPGLLLPYLSLGSVVGSCVCLMFCSPTPWTLRPLKSMRLVVFRYVSPKGPCTQNSIYTHIYGDYLNAEVYPVWVHGHLGLQNSQPENPKP